MKSKLTWLEVVMLAAPFLVLAICWPNLPSRIPVHWNLHGQVDGWSEKIPGLFLLPAIMVGVVTLLRILPRFDPRLQGTPGDEGRMPAVLPIIRIALLALCNAIFFVQIATSLGVTAAGGRIIPICVLVFFIVLGNYLGNVRPNYFVGIRTPWALENSETWRATHRLGGRLMFFGALILLVAQVFLRAPIFGLAFGLSILSWVTWGFVYSWHHCRTHVATN
jgi:immunity protein, SdpI family